MSAVLPRKRARLTDTTNEDNVSGSSTARPRSAGGPSPLALHPPKWRSQVDLKPLVFRCAVLDNQPRALDPTPGRMLF